MNMSDVTLEHKMSALEKKVFLLEKKLARTLNGRKEAEKLLDVKSRELFIALEQQKVLVKNLEEKTKELDAELVDSQDDYKFLLDNIIDIVCELNHEGVFLKIKGDFKKILGYELNELLGENYVDLIPEEYREEIVGFYLDSINNLQKDSFREIPLLAKNGETIWLGQTVRLIIENGHFVKAVVVARDVSEQRKIRENHEIERLRLNVLINNMPQAILLEDEQRRIIKVNKEFCNLFSIPAEPNSLIGVDCSTSARESKHLFENSDDFERQIDRVLKNKKLETHHFLKMLNGKVLLRDFIPIKKQGHYLGHMWMYHDMTVMEQKDFLLAQSEIKYSKILENLELGILEVDSDENITRVFPKFEELSGYSAQELVGKNAQEVFFNDEVKVDADAINELRLLNKASAYETTIATKTGQIKNVLISGAPILNGIGDVTGSLGIHFDITEMKNLEKYLRKAKDEAEAAKKSEQIFTARMSHEVKTPLTALQGTLALMENEITDERLLGLVNSAGEAAKHLRSLVDDILEISRLKAAKFKPKFERFELKPFLKSLMANFKILANEKGLDLVFIYEPETINTIVLDKKMLYQIVTNLLSNAIKFTQNGFVGLNVTSKLKGKNKHLLIIDVFDSGIGIDDDDKELIFGNYGRSNKIENEFDGAGLGLGIVKGFTQLLKGNVSVTSEIGNGSCFTLRFDLDLDKKVVKPKGKLSQEEKKPLKEIFIIDDSNQIRSYAENVLNQYKLKVRSFADGFSAINSLKKIAQPQVVLVDYRMPFLTGVEVANKLREAEYSGKIILMSAITAETLEEVAKDGDIDSLLTKPFLPNDLIVLLSEYFILTKKRKLEIGDENFYLPEFNNKHIIDIYGYNAKYFNESINIFLREIDQTIETLEIDLQGQNRDDLSFKLHKLKPTLNMVNLVELSKQVGVLEKEVVESFDSTKTRQLIERLKEIVKQHKIILKEQLIKLESYV